MLQEAHALRARGLDVVVGFVETYGRARHPGAAQGPRESFRGGRSSTAASTLEEMDVDAIVAPPAAGRAWSTSWRTPTCPAAAHAEALRGRARAARRRHPRDDGREHPAPRDAERRGRDGDRRAGARDGARHVPRSRRRGRSTSTSRSRSCATGCAQGKIYRPEKVEQALTNFFRKGNLSTLRELALRAVADEVGEKAASYRAREGLEPALIPERVMVCMSSNALAPRVIGPARASPAGSGSNWYAVYVETPREQPGRIEPAGRRRAAAEHPPRREPRRDGGPREGRAAGGRAGRVRPARRRHPRHLRPDRAVAVGTALAGLDARSVPHRRSRCRRAGRAA